MNSSPSTSARVAPGDWLTSIRVRFSQGWRRLSYLARRFGEDNCAQIAGSLTYMSLFALVPLITVTYTMAAMVPATQGVGEQMQQFIFDNLVPETGQEIQNYLTEFSDQAKNLTGFGIAFLVITAVLMLRSVEKAFNAIWRTGRHRSAVSSFLLYWAVLSLTPVTIGLALGLSTYVSSMQLLVDEFDAVALSTFGLKFAPVLLMTVGFTLLYAAVPNAKVPIRHAVVGGFLTAVIFNVARSGFTTLMVNSSYTLIYGAFAAVPLFLLWVFLSWNIVLAGGILVHSFMAYQDRLQASRPLLLKALDVLYVFYQQQQLGEPVRELRLLGDRYSGLRGLDSDTWRDLRELLTREKVITEDASGNYVLCRDLATLPLWQLKAWINAERPLGPVERRNDLPWKATVHELLSDQRASQREHLNLSLAELYHTP